MLKGGKKKVREDSGVGIKPMSPTGTKRLVRRAIVHALENRRTVVTLVHKGNIQKFTEGAFRDWGYELATQEFRDYVVTERESWILGNKDSNPDITVEQNAALIEPGLDQAPEDFKQGAVPRSRAHAGFALRVARQGRVEEENPDQRPHRRLRVPAGAHSRR